MKTTESMKQLFQYASEYKFEEFEKLFSKLETSIPKDELADAYLMRAQIKLYATDPTILGDLERIEKNGRLHGFPLLSTIWQADMLNRFVVFPKTPGILQAFLQLLPHVAEKFAEWYGERGHILVRQIHGEICYFMGEIHKALDYAEEQYKSELITPKEAVFSLIMQYRCNLALNQQQRAEECLLDVLRCSKANPECVEMYKAFRGWANLTNNWNGDSPRFFEDENGKKQPILKERVEGIKMGIARTTPLEMPFVEFAQRSYENTQTLRDYYMDGFHAIYWFSVDDCKQAESYFEKLYETTKSTGICMPIVEYGEHITPFLMHIKSSALNCSKVWLDNMIFRTEEYEKSLTSASLESFEEPEDMIKYEDNVQTHIKDRLFDKAIELFSSRGYENVSMNNIANAVGIMTPSIYNHYKSKESILNDIYDYYGNHFFDNQPPLSEIQSLMKNDTAEKIVKTLSWTFYGMPLNMHIRMTMITKIIYARFLIDEKANRFFCDVMLKENIKYGQSAMKILMDSGRVKSDFDGDRFIDIIIYVGLMTGIVGVSDCYSGDIVNKKESLKMMLAKLLDGYMK